MLGLVECTQTGDPGVRGSQRSEQWPVFKGFAFFLETRGSLIGGPPPHTPSGKRPMAEHDWWCELEILELKDK